MSKTELEIHSTDSVQLYGGFVGGDDPGCQDYCKPFKLNGVRIVDEKWLLKLVAERDELARWKELVSNGSMLQALRDKAERERDQLLEAAQHILAILQHPTKHVNIFDQEKLEEAVAKITTTGPRYTSVSKGGSYVKLGAIRGAGSLKGLAGIAYQNEKGDLFIREPECFAKRIVLVEQGGAS